MPKILENLGLQRVLRQLPPHVSREIEEICAGGKGGFSALREIALRRGGACSLLLRCEKIKMKSKVSREEMEGLVKRLTDGALYAHRDSIASGYICLEGGLRVGVCGHARYDGERLVGVGDISSLIFRIPGGECAFGDEIYSAYLSGVRSGMLIYSPPGVGKTTALRHLAKAIGGRGQLRVAVVDERLEFCESDYSGCDVDILRGYKRRQGIEIATRTMSPDVIIIDEIGGDDAASIIDVLRCGIPIIATAHASSFEEIKAKRSIAPLISIGAFDLFVGIKREGGGYRLRVDRL